MDDTDALLVPILAVLNKATQISSTLSAHRGGENAIVVSGDIVAGLIYVLMTEMSNEDMQSSIDEARRIVDEVFEGDDEDETNNPAFVSGEDVAETEEVHNIGASTYRCNCDLCTRTRVAILNFPSFEPQSVDQQWVYNAICKTASEHQISIEGVEEA